MRLPPESMAKRLTTIDAELAAAGRSRADGYRVHACLDLDLWPGPRDRPPKGPMHGTAEQLLDMVGRYADVGVTDVVLSAMSPEALAGGRSRLVDQLERFSSRGDGPGRRVKLSGLPSDDAPSRPRRYRSRHRRRYLRTSRSGSPW